MIFIETDPIKIEEIGNIVSKIRGQYTILNYDEEYICNDDEERGKYRSVVLHTDSNKLVCIAPPMSLTIKCFETKYTNPIPEEIYLDELIEGTMIQLFYDHDRNEWEIATKKSISGNYSYFANSTTFRSMTSDAFGEPGVDISKLSFLSSLNKKMCYHFILQHPLNHIVLPIKDPRMVLVSVYEIISKNSACFISPCEYKKWDFLESLKEKGIIHYPSVLTIEEDTNSSSYKSIISKHLTIHTPFTTMGLMFTNVKTGDHCPVVNATYEEAKKLRGNHPNLQYQYLCVRRTGKITEFLKYFPMYKKMFYGFNNDFCNYAHNLHQAYMQKYVLSSSTEISKKYYYHVKQIHHTLYLPSLQSGSKIIIRKTIVRDYLDSLDPDVLLHILNYEKLQYVKAFSSSK